MTLCPTNVYRRIGQEFAYSIDTQLDVASLRRALNRVAASRGLRCSETVAEEFKASNSAGESDTVSSSWTLVLPLGSEFGPDDVAVKLDDGGLFSVLAEAASHWHEGDFVRIVRHVQLPVELLDVDSVRCWIEEACLFVQADRLAPKTSPSPPLPGKKQHHQVQQPQPLSLRNAWPRGSLSDSKQRQGCVIKEKFRGGGSGARWTLDLALPEFRPEEVSVTTVTPATPEPADGEAEIAAAPTAPAARLLVTAQYFAEDASSLDCTMRHDYRREVTPPTGVPLSQVVASFLGNGLLRLSAPLPASAVKPRRTIVGLVGGSAGGAGAKILSLTRELRQGGTHRRAQPQASAGSKSASLPRQPSEAAESAAANGRGRVRSSDGRNCTVQ